MAVTRWTSVRCDDCGDIADFMGEYTLRELASLLPSDWKFNKKTGATMCAECQRKEAKA